MNHRASRREGSHCRTCVFVVIGMGLKTTFGEYRRAQRQQHKAKAAVQLVVRCVSWLGRVEQPKLWDMNICSVGSRRTQSGGLASGLPLNHGAQLAGKRYHFAQHPRAQLEWTEQGSANLVHAISSRSARCLRAVSKGFLFFPCTFVTISQQHGSSRMDFSTRCAVHSRTPHQGVG